MNLCLAASFLLLTAVCGADESERLPLWNGKAPIGDDKLEDAEAWITVHRPSKANGAAIVICPGGGYGTLVKNPEGHGIAAWLNQHGITGVVLEIASPPAGRLFLCSTPSTPSALCRASAKNWEINPSKIGIIGFSAGGHLAATAGTHFDEGDAAATDALNRASCRPDFLILVYPVIVLDEKTHRGFMTNLFGKEPSPKIIELFSNEKHVTPRTPPAFLAHSQDDKVVPPQHSQAFYSALQAQRIPAHYLELPSGGHGLNGYKGPMWDAWQAKSLSWLADLKVIPTAHTLK